MPVTWGKNAPNTARVTSRRGSGHVAHAEDTALAAGRLLPRPGQFVCGENWPLSDNLIFTFIYKSTKCDKGS